MVGERIPQSLKKLLKEKKNHERIGNFYKNVVVFILLSWADATSAEVRMLTKPEFVSTLSLHVRASSLLLESSLLIIPSSEVPSKTYRPFQVRYIRDSRIDVFKRSPIVHPGLLSCQDSGVCDAFGRHDVLVKCGTSKARRGKLPKACDVHLHHELQVMEP